jgi:hypothetical protein
MFAQFRMLALGLAVVVTMGLSCPAPADEEIPFRGHADVVITAVDPQLDGLHLTASAEGLATHLGLFTRDEEVILQGDGTLVGSLTFIAADGDELYAVADGGFISATTAVGTYTFTGGTGRFTNASGEAGFVGVTFDGIHIALAFEGSIAL